MKKFAIIAIIWIFLLQAYIIYLITVTNIRIDKKSEYHSIAIQNMENKIIKEINDFELEIEYNEIN